MFKKALKIVKDDDVLVDMKIVPILHKFDFFFPNDRLLLFGSNELSHFSVPKKSQVFFDGVLIGHSGASGSMDVVSDQYTGMLHALYISN